MPVITVGIFDVGDVLHSNARARPAMLDDMRGALAVDEPTFSAAWRALSGKLEEGSLTEFQGHQR